jgi:hypothetical protein
MTGYVSAAIVVGSVVGGAISASGAKSAANTQAAAADRAGTVSQENLQLQLAADKETVDKQLAAQKSALDQTLLAQKTAADAGNAASAAALEKQLAAQKSALDQTLGLQRELYNKQVENLSSFKSAGEAGQARLLDLLGLSGNKDAPGYGSATTTFKVEGFNPNTLLQSFNTQQMEADPGYAFRLEEGQKAIDRSAAAKGGLQSGAALKAAAEYGQSMGSQEYQNAYNRFMTTQNAQAQNYGNAFNRFQTERNNTLAPLQNLQTVGEAAAAQQSASAGALSSGSSGALQNYGANTSNAYGAAGAAQGQTAANLGTGSSTAYGNYGAGLSNIYGASNQNRTSAYGTNSANQIASITGAANALASGQVGSANAYSQGISSAISGGVGAYNAYNQNQLLTNYLSKLPTGSDAIIKENIRQVGVLDNGLNVYEYEYKAPYKDTWGHGQQIGVMAHEVEQIIPEAVSVHPDGYKMVNYSMIH